MPGISVTKIPIPFQKAGFNFVHYWSTRNAYFALPATGVSLMVGREVTIYGDELVSLPIGKTQTVTYTCDIGSASGNNYVINPIAANVGNHSLRVVVVSNGVERLDETIILTVYEKGIGTIGLLRIGDSTIGGEEIATELDAVLDDSTITYLGTQGTTNKHEGYSGMTYHWFATHADSPFVKGGVLDVDAYFTDNSIATPDFVNIRLGINDVFGAGTITGDGLTDLEMAAIIADAETLLDGFLAHDAALKVIISLPSTTENTGAGWNNNYDESVYSQDMFLEAIHKFQKGLSDTFANGTYDARVDCSYEVINLDRDDGYPKTDGAHTNGVHPDASGYVQLADGLALKLNSLLLSSELITNGDFSAWTEDNPDGWNVYEVGADIFTEAPDGCRILTTGAFISMAQAILTAGRTYRTKIRIVQVTAGAVGVNLSLAVVGVYSTTGDKVGDAVADGVGFTIRRNAGATDVIFNDVSCKEILYP